MQKRWSSGEVQGSLDSICDSSWVFLIYVVFQTVCLISNIIYWGNDEDLVSFEVEVAITVWDNSHVFPRRSKNWVYDDIDALHFFHEPLPLAGWRCDNCWWRCLREKNKITRSSLVSRYSKNFNNFVRGPHFKTLVFFEIMGLCDYLCVWKKVCDENFTRWYAQFEHKCTPAKKATKCD